MKRILKNEFKKGYLIIFGDKLRVWVNVVFKYVIYLVNFLFNSVNYICMLFVDVIMN